MFHTHNPLAKMLVQLVSMATIAAAATGCEPAEQDLAAAEGDRSKDPAETEKIGCYNSEYFCEIDIDNGSISCPYLPDPSDVTVLSANSSGQMVLRLDMTDWSAMQIKAEATSIQNYAFHIGNSISNNGWAGDSGHSLYDSEAHMYNNGLYVYRNDIGGSGLAGSLGNAIPNGNGSMCVTVTDSELTWYGTPAGSPQSTTYVNVSDPDIFQIGADDSFLYIGFNRTVGSAGRTGSNFTGVALLELLPL